MASSVDRSHRLPDVDDFTNTVEVCRSTATGVPSLLFGNEGANLFLTWSDFDNSYVDTGDGSPVLLRSSGLFLSAFEDDTTHVRCADVVGDRATDLLLIGNEGRRTWMYTRR